MMNHRPTTVKAVLFDLDETLLDDERTALTAQEMTCRWAAEHRPDIEPDRLQEAYHDASVSFWKTYDQATEKRSGQELRRGFWHAGLNACGIHDEDFAETLSQTYHRMRDETYRLFPDAVPCLDALKGRYTLGLVSNGSSYLQRLKVDALGLERWLDFVLIAEDVGISKPDPGIFEVALHRAGCAAHEAVMVGDLLDRDILGAMNAGILPIWIDRSAAPGFDFDHQQDLVPATYRVNLASQTPRPEHTITSLAELPELLERLRAE